MEVNHFNFIHALHTLVQRYRFVLVFTAVMTCIGVVVALNRSKTFTSTVVLAPELNSRSRTAESLTSITAMFGVNLNRMSNSNNDAIYPGLYPQIVSSPDFVVELWNSPVQTEDGIVKTYYEHILEDGYIPFWRSAFSWITSGSQPAEVQGDSLPDTRYLTPMQEAIIARMSNNIVCEVSDVTGLITISVDDLDPCVACSMADTVQHKLQHYITRYRTLKARKDYEYAQRLVDEARQEYLDAQFAAANFADANISVFKQKVIIERDILNNEFQLKYNSYNALSAQLQNAKALIQEATPVYTIIRRASVPNYPSSSPRHVVVIIYALVGFLAAIVWILFGERYFQELIAEYKKVTR